MGEVHMKPRLDYYKHFPEAFNKLVEIGNLVNATSLNKLMIHLVMIRVSQINGCLFCIDIHSKMAKKDGEKELRLYHLTAWRNSELFNQTEKAALEWAEAVTNMNLNEVSDEIYNKTRESFSEKELVQLTMAIVEINSWNRISGIFKAEPGSLDKMYGLDSYND